MRVAFFGSGLNNGLVQKLKSSPATSFFIKEIYPQEETDYVTISDRFAYSSYDIISHSNLFTFDNPIQAVLDKSCPPQATKEIIKFLDHYNVVINLVDNENVTHNENQLFNSIKDHKLNTFRFEKTDPTEQFEFVSKIMLNLYDVKLGE